MYLLSSWLDGNESEEVREEFNVQRLINSQRDDNYELFLC